MNYASIYSQLVAKAQNRVLEGYFEKHHIVPKCMGGSNAKGNIVLLTAKEHFMAHKLLVRIHPEIKGLWYALVAMGRLIEFKSRVFESERSKAAEMRRGFRFTVESRAKMSVAKLGKKSPSPATTFKPGSTPWNAGKRGPENHMYGTKRTEEQRKRMCEAQRLCGNIPPSRKGIKMTEEQKEKARKVRAFNKQSKQLGGLQ